MTPAKCTPVLFACCAALLCSGCGAPKQPEDAGQPDASGFRVTSSAFEHGASLPAKHGKDGENVSPPLAWENAPESAASFAVLCESPDLAAAPWVQWGIYNIPATAKGLPEAVPPGAQIPAGMRQALNDFGRNAYDGPAPPRGHAYLYQFKVYALDTSLDLGSERTSAAGLHQAMEGHVLAQASIEATYQP